MVKKRGRYGITPTERLSAMPSVERSSRVTSKLEGTSGHTLSSLRPACSATTACAMAGYVLTKKCRLSSTSTRGYTSKSVSGAAGLANPRARSATAMGGSPAGLSLCSSCWRSSPCFLATGWHAVRFWLSPRKCFCSRASSRCSEAGILLPGTLPRFTRSSSRLRTSHSFVASLKMTSGQRAITALISITADSWITPSELSTYATILSIVISLHTRLYPSAVCSTYAAMIRSAAMMTGGLASLCVHSIISRTNCGGTCSHFFATSALSGCWFSIRW